jgi:hypothetical protein
MNNKNIIRAADYLPESNADCDGDDFELSVSEELVLNLFGDMPDYSNPKYEEIWQEIMDDEDDVGIAFCLGKGVDVMGDDGEPVSGWRDIAVMLKAVERGIIKYADKPESEDEA